MNAQGLGTSPCGPAYLKTIGATPGVTWQGAAVLDAFQVAKPLSSRAGQFSRRTVKAELPREVTIGVGQGAAPNPSGDLAPSDPLPFAAPAHQRVGRAAGLGVR
jgi:hypothetical protein